MKQTYFYRGSPLKRAGANYLKLQYKWHRRRGCKCTPKSFYLSNIRATSLKNLGKMWPNVVWF